MDLFSLAGRVAIVTGGSRGIGRAIALALAEAGADVVVASRKLPDLESVAGEITALGRRSLAIAAHMGRSEDIENLVSTVRQEFGRIDILVNNAGTNPVFEPLLKSEERAWDHIMNVNLKGYFLVSQAVARTMITQKKGSIINVASVGGLRPLIGLGIYSVSKAGVIMLTRALAGELGKYNIRVNALAPGVIQTRFSEALWGNPEILRRTVESSALGRIGQPEEIAGAALYLASDASSYVSGQTIVLNGGEAAGAG
ncbi:MAG: glucose 1-dehydrogenase [Chloroflexi bacterium]|nr:glucose 1-dehydrogenase [Chloroflexota bacterium]